MNKTKPLVSVIIHSYNRFDFLINAINSVKKQSLNDLEIILLNDESTDNRYYQNLLGSSIQQIDIKRNQNLRWTGSRQSLINVGVDIAKGKYIALLDDDDIWLEKKLEIQLNEMEKNYFKFSSTEGYFGIGPYNYDQKYPLYNQEYFYDALKKKYRYSKYLKFGKFPKIWTESFLKIHNCVIKSSVIIEKELFKTVGGFRGIPSNADYDFWLNLLKVENLLYIDSPLFYYDGSHGEGKNY